MGMTIDAAIFIGCLGLWCASLSWLVATTACAVLQPLKRRSAAATTIGPVSIIVSTCAVDDRRTARDRAMAMASLLELNYPDYEIIVSVDRGDNGGSVVGELRRCYSDDKVRVVVASKQLSANAKVDGMAAGAAAARHPILLFSDDDILVDRAHLGRLVAQLRENVGLVSAAAIGIDPRNFWGDVELAFMNGQFARLHLAGDFLGFSGALGKAILIRPSELVRAGGLYRTGADCCEDASLTRNLKSVGLKVALSDRPVLQPILDQRFIDVWRRHRRWLSCRRRYLPAVFALEGLFSTASSCVAGGFSAAYLFQDAVGGIVGTALLWCAIDLMLRILKRWHLGMATPFAWLVRETLFVPMWLSALWARTVTWYGRNVPVAVS
jgi:ceramide glucosyltransferase